MPTEKHRVNVTVEDWMWDAIEDFRYTERLSSKSQAAVELMRRALQNVNSTGSLDKELRDRDQAVNDQLANCRKPPDLQNKKTALPVHKEDGGR